MIYSEKDDTGEWSQTITAGIIYIYQNFRPAKGGPWTSAEYADFSELIFWGKYRFLKNWIFEAKQLEKYISYSPKMLWGSSRRGRKLQDVLNLIAWITWIGKAFVLQTCQASGIFFCIAAYLCAGYLGYPGTHVPRYRTGGGEPICTG